MGGLVTIYYYGHGPSFVLASIYPFVNSLECGTVALNWVIFISSLHAIFHTFCIYRLRQMRLWQPPALLMLSLLL
jgi:hypothetical protein